MDIKASEKEKRVFFGYEVASPWPTHYPKGRVIDSNSRHLTLAFLGSTLYSQLEKILSEFPAPPFKIGPVGFFDRSLFLPEKHPRVVAWHLQSYDKEDHLVQFQKTISEWLQNNGYSIDSRPFLPHVTIARSPLHVAQWQESFVELPSIITKIHLYESKGNLVYKPLWSYPLLLPFEELSHAADIAYLIQAESMSSLHLHAQMALAFKYPQLLKYMPNIHLKHNLDEIIAALNELISIADCDIGCPLKAVSFHGNIKEELGILKWVMIVDV